MDLSTDSRFASLSSIRKCLKEYNLSTNTGQSFGSERFQILSSRLTAHLYEIGEMQINPTNKKIERSPPKIKEIPVYNERVDRSLSVIQLKGKLEAHGIDSSTPGLRGEDRHDALFEKLSICYDEDDKDSDGEESYEDSDYEEVERNPDWGDGEEDNPNRFYSNFGKAASSISDHSKKDSKKPDGYVKRQYLPHASGASKDQCVPPPRDWASTASYNDDYDTISSAGKYEEEEEEEEEEGEEEILHPVEEPIDSSNRYGGFEQYGAQYRKRQFDNSSKEKERKNHERRKEEETTPAQNDGQDYIDVISSHFKLSEKKNITPTPILRPSTRERDRAKRRPTTGDRVTFNEPVEPYVPAELRVDDNKPRATLHEHQSNERIRRSQRKKEGGETEREMEKEKIKTKQQQAQQKKMAKLKAKLGASAPTSPKPKSSQGRREPFDNLPPPSPGKKEGESGTLPRSFPRASSAGSSPLDAHRPASRRFRKIKKVTGRIKSCKQSRVTSIESRLDIRSPMCDPDVKEKDKKASQHEVEVARIKVINSRAKQTMVSSILVDSGKMRLPAQNLLKQLQQRLAAAKKELTIEQQRVRAEENSSEVHGKQVEASLMEQVRRMEAADAGVGGFSSGESDNDGAGDDDRDDGSATLNLKMPSAGFPTVQPPPSPLLNLPDAASVEDNSPVPQNALIMPVKRQESIKLPKHDEPQALPPSTTAAPPIHNPGNPIFNASAASSNFATAKQPPPKVPKSDRLGLEAVRMQAVDPKRACELHEESLKHNPENINTLNNYALFCHKTLKKMDDAEALFKRGIIVADLILFDLEEADEDGDVSEFRIRNRLKITASATLMSNYANFLKSVRGYATSAETLHEKAINLSPDHAPGIGNYAKFLMDSKHDFVAAEDMFKRALKVDPVHSGNLTSYARMLKKMGRFDAAEKVYATAVGVDATNVVLLCNYANFMKKVRGDLEAAKVLYEKGMAMNPDAEYLQKNYKIFLRDYEKSGGKAGPLGGIKKKPSPINKVNKAAEKAEKVEKEKKAKAMQMEEERRRREEVVSSAKKMMRGGEGEGNGDGKEEDSDEEGEGEDAFVMDDKIPAHLLTQKRDPSQMPVEVGVEGWVCYNHPQYGLYYYNEFTNKSTYDKPADFKKSEHAFAKMRSFDGEKDAPDEPADILNSRRSEAEKPIEVGNGGWNKFMDDESGWEYWHNEKTGESTYDRPEVYETSNDPFAGVQSGGGGDEHAHKPDVDILSSRRSEAEQPKEVLYDGWVRYVDEESGYEYYVNSVMEESTYDRPKGYETSSDPFGGMRGKKSEEYKPDVDILSSRRSEAEQPKEVLYDGWVRYVDEESGYEYYVNSVTEESTYDRPKGYETKNDPFGGVRGKKGEEYKPDVDILNSRRGEGEMPKEKMNGDWARYLDEESGYAYYFNSQTEESTYDRPNVYETKNDPFGGARAAANGSGNGNASKPDVDILNSRRGEGEMPKEKMNGSWARYLDEESGYAYYFNSQTEESTYDRPNVYETSNDPFGGVRGKEEKKPDAGLLNNRRGAGDEPVELLTDGWEKFMDAESGHFYYYHEDTDTSTYDRPDNFVTDRNPFDSVRGQIFGGGSGAGGGGGEKESADILSSRRGDDAVVEEFLNGGWCKYADDATGYEYYYNEAEGTSTYDRPDGFQTHQNPFGGVR